ncbi:hypothetical protein J6590_043465 [Homalodisca vitripennis]|nr:hypothetical protein J6590_043465 [Homalodisca vitripennis]
MLNNYAESGGGFNSNHGQTSRPAETQKQQNISSTWGYNGQLEGMYYGGEHQPMFMGSYEGSTKHSNYPQYPTGSLHQPVPTPVVKCHEACCQHFQDRYPLNPAPLRYQPSGPVQPRYDGDSRQWRSVQPLSRKKVYSTENGYPGISERHFSQYMGRGQLMADSRQHMQMMRSQYPMYSPYWGGPRGWTGPRMNCPPPPYHQTVSQGAQLQTGLKMSEAHYIDPSTQKTPGSHRRGVTSGGGATDVVRPVPEPKRSTLDPNLQSCYEFGYPTGFVPFSEVNKIQSGSLTSQNNTSNCKIPTDKTYHPHQMQYSLQGSDRNMMNCSSSINELNYPMNFPMPGSDSHIRPGLEDNQQISDARKLPLQYDSSLGKKRPDLDLRQYLATWEDDEDESTRLSESIPLGNSGAPYIVVDCRSLEGDAAAKLQERFKTSTAAQNCASKQRSSSPNSERKTDDQPRQDENTERSNLPPEFQSQTSYASSMPALLSDSEKNVNYWNGSNRDSEGIIGKGGAFQPLDCSKRDSSIDPNNGKRDGHPQNDLSAHKLSSANESGTMSFDALVSYYGDNRRIVDGGYDFVEMTERLVNTSEKPSTNIRTSLDHPIPSEMSRPCDPRLQQSQLGGNPSIYNKVAPRYPTSSYQHYKPMIPADPYYNYKHSMGANKYFGYENSQMIDPTYDYHKMPSDFETARLYGNKEISKDPRRMYHQEIDKSVESAFLDPVRKAQIDCFQDKSLEFGSVDHDQFISPIIMKSTDQHNRDKDYSEKNSSIRDGMNILNNEIPAHSEKTVLITSQNGPPEIFRVPYSPEKDLSHKDNLVTLHSGDQTKSNTITVEVPYDQQYSTLVKLSEEISRSENGDVKSKDKTNSSVSSNELNNEEFKKPTSFKLKRLPNSKEWTVEGKEYNEPSKRSVSQNNSVNEENSCDVADDRDVLKSSVTVSSLNMPSLDDIRDGDETCEVNDNHPKSQLSDGILCSNKNVCDDISKTKYNTQTPQMAIVQPMKLTQSEPELIESSSNKLIDKNDKDDAIQQPLSSINSQSPTQLNYNPEKSPVGHSHLDLISDSDISKHENFRTHKKIQNSFSNGLPNCLTSPSEDFLHSSNINPGSTKDSYSPFHVYSDCDMNTQITDYFKIDERTNSGEKMLDTRVPSSPGVDGMFEDINHANQSQLYPQKSCNFQDLTDPNMTSLSAHNAHFQSFSSIFSEDDDKRGRPDGSVLQIGDKKYLKNLLDDIENHHISGCQEEQEDRLQGNSLNEILNEKTDEVKKSPPIPSISLKLNETKKMWCIAKKDKQVNHKTSLETESVLKSNILTHSTQGTVNEFRGVEASSIKNQIDCAYSDFSEIKKTNLNEPPSTSLPRQLQNSDTAEQNLLLDDHRVDKQKLSSTNNISFPGDTATTKMCLTITKYYPRAELFKRITNPASPNLGILVFDENGTHFPKSYDSSGVEVSERVDICQSIITSIFDQTFDFISLRKRNVPNKSSNDSLYHHYKKTNTAISSNQNINEVLFTDTVIKFDSSYSFSKDKKDQVNNIVKTTEVFIQREKENCQHHSVIKTTQLQDYCSKIKTRKTSRSIFSPMSDNGFEDDPIFSKKRKIAGHENIQHEDNINFDILNKDSGHKEKMHDVEDFESHVLDYSSRKSISESTEEPEELSKQLVMNRITDEVFKGFGSPKEVPSQQTFSESLNELTESKKSENSPYHELDKEQNIIKDNLEIDNALELMGLSSTKHLDKANKKYSIECIGKESSVSLQEALENEPDWFSRQDDDYINLPLGACLQRDNVNSDKKDKQVEEENVQCDKNNSSVEITEVKEVCNKSKICQDITKVKEASSVVKTHTNENLIIVSESQEHAEDLCQTTSQRHLPKDTLIGFVNEDVDLTFSQDMDSSYDLPIENHSQTEGIDSLNHPQSYFSPELGATFNKEESLEAWPIVNTGLLSCSTPIIKDSQADPQIEDLEARLETSVIVRNNSCSSFIYNQSDESSITVCQNSIPSQQVVHLEIEQLNTLNDDSKINLRSTENCQQTTSLYLETSQKSTKSNPLNGISEELKSHNNCLQQETYTSKMDCQVENPNDVSKICTESHIENSSTESVANQTPVITSKDMSVSNTINTFKSLGEEDSLMGYCAGESVFMCLDEEVKTYLKRSKLSYFHEFKKRKWQKFFKTVNKKDISNRYIVENKKGNLNNKVYTNEVFDYQSEKVCTKNILPETIVENKETKNSPSPVSVEMDSGIEDESHVQYSDSNLKDKSFHSKCTNNTKETSIQLNCEYQSPKQLMFESVNDSTVEERTSLITNTDKASAPLKDKSQFFIEKDSRVFHTRRDSFKMLEPEFVLKEIFSPDPETDDSESKENECPMNFSQIKYETSPHLMETNLALTTNSISPSLPILSTKFNKLSDCMTSKNPGIEDTLSNTHELDIVKTLDCNDCNTSIHDSGGKNTIQNFNDPIEPDYDKQVSTAGLVQDVNQVNATLPLQEEPEMAKKDSDEAGGLTFQIISNTEVSRFTNNPFSSQRDNTLENVSSNVIDQGSTTSTNVINNVENCQNLHLFAQELHNNNNTPVVENMAELSLCQETKACKNKGLKQSTLLEEDTVTFSEKFEKTSTFVENIGERVLQNPKYIAGSIQSTKNIVEFKSSDDSEIDQTCSSKSVPIQQCHGAHSTYSYDDTGLQEKKDKSISLINQDNQTQQITKSSPRQNSLNNEDMFEIDYKENGSGEPMVMSPKGDLTSTKYYKEDQVRNSDINSKNDSKECNVEEQQNTGCHDEKINTVQDSLRNSVNNETFPLQCLVEAALALESVDSKQVMFSNSNFPVLYNQTEDKSLTFSKIPDGTNDSSVKTVQSSFNNNSTRSGESSSNENHLTPTDREIFSKFEETNYNLRASTRIVTSSSSNIIPYSKRKYGLKSSKINTSQGIKQKKTEINVTEKSRTKKRRGAFTYPRSKRRKKVTKNKQKLGQALQQDNFNEVASNIPESNNDVKCCVFLYKVTWKML